MFVDRIYISDDDVILSDNVEFKVCPFCNTRKYLHATPKKRYLAVLKSKPYGTGSLVSVECAKCDLTLSQHHYGTEEKYEETFEKMKEKWNRRDADENSEN